MIKFKLLFLSIREDFLVKGKIHSEIFIAISWFCAFYFLVFLAILTTVIETFGPTDFLLPGTIDLTIASTIIYLLTGAYAGAFLARLIAIFFTYPSE